MNYEITPKIQERSPCVFQDALWPLTKEVRLRPGPIDGDIG